LKILNRLPPGRALLLLAATLALLVVIYLPTLLTQINGGADPYMDDAGEVQVALNVWGTIHHTGYPVYTILGNIATVGLRSVGVSAATAPVLYTMAWGLVALAAFYLLVWRLTGRAEIAAAATLLLGLARSVWIHNVIAEVYSMSFAFEAILLAIALWGPVTAGNVRRRTWLLALAGGFGVAHHRMVIFMAPGLLLAVWPCLRADFVANKRHTLATLGGALLIGLVGFVPYVYLPARALAHADWVYGDPSTLPGFWHEFTGAEAAFLMHLPVDGRAWLNDFGDTFRILATELTPVFAVAGGLALVWAMIRSRFRREARIAFVCTLGYFAFLFALHRVVMPEAVAMPIVMVLVLALALALDAVIPVIATAVLSLLLGLKPVLKWATTMRLAWRYVLAAGFGILATVILTTAQGSFIYHLTHNDTGLAMIDLAKHVPRENGKAVLMLPWGPRYDAVAFSKFVTKVNADLRIVTHKADFGALASEGDILFTSKDTFYQFPLSWWDSQIGRAYLSSAADGLVAIRRAPVMQPATASDAEIGHGIVRRSVSLCIAEKTIHLTINWGVEQTPDADLSVFVHLLAGDAVVAQADSSAPVYGWYATSRWSAGEVINDNYVLPRLPESTDVSIGMYEQPSPGQFKNYGILKVPLAGPPGCGQ
jgi:Protein of unknown function (DUF2723)